VVTAQAELLDLPPEVLARKRDVEALVRYFLEQKQVRLPDSIAQGWRYDAVGKQLKQAVEALNG